MSKESQFFFKVKKECRKGKIKWSYGEEWLNGGQTICGHSDGNLFENENSYHYDQYLFTVKEDAGHWGTKDYPFPTISDADTASVRACILKTRIDSLCQWVKDCDTHDATTSGEAVVFLTEEQTREYVARKAKQVMKKEEDKDVPF